MLNLGVTGHRHIPDERQLDSRVRRALGSLEERFPGESLRLYSSLAEGADRIVAWQVLERETASLVAVLPMRRRDYEVDFADPGSRDEFSQLLAKADSVVELPILENRTRCYEQAGLYVLDHSDLLVAVWDGQPVVGLGGTGQIVGHAVARRLPVLWVHTDDSMPTEAALSWLNPPESRREAR